MINYPTKKLGKIVLIKKGKNPELFKIQKDGMLPYLGVKFMRGTKDAEFAFISDKKAVAVSEKDLIIICDGSKSGDMFSGFEGILSSTMGKMEFDINILNPRYLKNFLDFNFELFNGSKKGAAIPHLDFKVFNNLEIPLPSLKTQKEIVMKLDEKMAKIKEAIKFREEALADTKQLLFQSIGEILGNLDCKDINMGDIGKMVSGGTPSRSNSDYWDGDIPWVSSGELNDINIFETRERITKSGLEKSNAKLLPIGTLLIGMYDTAALKMSICRNEITTNQAIIGLLPNGKFITEFIYYQLTYLRPQIMKIRQGVRQKNLNSRMIKSIQIKLPSFTEQQKIVKRLDDLSAKIRQAVELQKSQLEELKKLEKAYLREAFNGELI